MEYFVPVVNCLFHFQNLRNYSRSRNYLRRKLYKKIKFIENSFFTHGLKY